MEVWDTWKGAQTASSLVHVGINGKARLPIPSVLTDVAVKLLKIGSGHKDKQAQ